MGRPCMFCNSRPAVVPDRERMGRPIKRVCMECHAARLRGDLQRVLEAHKKMLQERRERSEPPPQQSKE